MAKQSGEIAQSPGTRSISPNMMISYMDRLSGIKPQETADKLNLSPNTVIDYAKRASSILIHSNINTQLVTRWQKALAPSAISALSKHLQKGTKEVLIKYMEGNGIWRKNINVQQNVITTSLKDLLEIIGEESTQNPNLQELKDSIEAEYTVEEDSNGNTAMDSIDSGDGGHHVVMDSPGTAHGRPSVSTGHTQCVDEEEHDGLRTVDKVSPGPIHTNMAMENGTQAGQAHRIGENNDSVKAEGSVTADGRAPCIPKESRGLSVSSEKITDAPNTTVPCSSKEPLMSTLRVAPAMRPSDSKSDGGALARQSDGVSRTSSPPHQEISVSPKNIIDQSEPRYAQGFVGGSRSGKSIDPREDSLSSKNTGEGVNTTTNDSSNWVLDQWRAPFLPKAIDKLPKVPSSKNIPDNPDTTVNRSTKENGGVSAIGNPCTDSSPSPKNKPTHCVEGEEEVKPTRKYAKRGRRARGAFGRKR